MKQAALALLHWIPRQRKRERQEIHAAYHRLFDTPDGQIVLADMAERWHAMRPTLAQNETGAVDVGLTSFQEGQRRSFLRCWSLWQQEPTKEDQE